MGVSPIVASVVSPGACCWIGAPSDTVCAHASADAH